ncbi:MAG: 30S ribosomal protein S16 [bacterium]|nr:30S ribosomal protein S16 [bacterium]
MLMIRMRRGGAKHNPIYRIVVSDSRTRPTSKYLDQVGFYNPHTDPPEIRIDLAKVEQWQEKGAGLSDTVQSLVRRMQTQQ